MNLSFCEGNLLFVPVVYMIANFVHHDGAFWGIRFPGRPSSFHQSIVYIVEKHLKGSGDPVLDTCLQGLYLAIVALAVVSEVDWEFVEHIPGFKIII